MATISPESATRSMDHRATKILVRFTGAPTVTVEQYEESIRRLNESGEFPPDGLEYHAAFHSEEGLRVSEVWDSQEQFETFGKRLMPLLADVGIELSGEPEMFKVLNTIKR